MTLIALLSLALATEPSPAGPAVEPEVSEQAQVSTEEPAPESGTEEVLDEPPAAPAVVVEILEVPVVREVVREIPIPEYGPYPPPEAIDFVGPMPVPEAPVVVVEPEARAFHPHDVLPWVALRGFWAGLFLAAIGGLFAVLAQMLSQLRERLAPRGLLPDLSAVGATGSRVMAAFFGLGAVGAWVPANVAPALPWIIVGIAAALGWSARDVLPDLVAFLVMQLEGRVRSGRWVSVEGFRGEVLSVGIRATVIVDERGGEVSLPNRVLVRSPYARDRSHWPRVDVLVRLPNHVDPRRARAALREAVLLSPWIAPGELEIAAATDGSGSWSVSVRLLEGTHLSLFEGSLRERVHEVLAER